ncbi:glycosyltransferase family 2 protein [Methylopila henanensis]|uniref:Glycosyltransferase family 2 protein n=1 Tax=Methylopila henanensis TaxID=873516 RepID=A0ABW4KC71_9HYPH
MTGVSVLTLARGRTAHLRKLVEGLSRCRPGPAELVLVDMNDVPPAIQETGFPIRRIELSGERLPLAAARNLAARSAVGERLLFLDADCIPSRALIALIERALDEVDGLVCPEALYLGPDDARGDWTEAELLAAGQPHPARIFPDAGLRHETNYGLFWSLAFGVRRTTFDRIGGFDEAFTGYGGEDTDFGFRAKEQGVPLVFAGGEVVFHQHHAVSDPPVEHLADIVRNAKLFHRKWGWWPMEGWLAAFERAGAIRLGGDAIEIVGKAV